MKLERGPGDGKEITGEATEYGNTGIRVARRTAEKDQQEGAGRQRRAQKTGMYV